VRGFRRSGKTVLTCVLSILHWRSANRVVNRTKLG
jgi:hypothetical protein